VFGAGGVLGAGMSVLFCRWAVAEEEEESEDASVKSSEQVSDDDVLGESDTTGKKDTNTSCAKVKSSFESTKISDEIAVPDSNIEPEEKVVDTVDELKVKDCLRAPGMVFSLWKDHEEEWESDVSEDFSEEEERPKFFSFTESQDETDVDEDEFVDKGLGSKEVEDNVTINEKTNVLFDTNLNDGIAHGEHETDTTESDFSVDDLVIKKIETGAVVKTEPAFQTTEGSEHIESEHLGIKKTFARKSTAPSRSVAMCKSINIISSKKTKSGKRHAQKMEKVAPVSKTQRRHPTKTSLKDSAALQVSKLVRPRRMVPSTYSRNTQMEVVAGTKLSLDEVKLEAEDNEGQLELCNLITDAIDVEESINKLKMEEFDDEEEDSYEYVSLGDPLGDPLSTQICSSVTARPFLWPKLDPLFHTVTEFKLSKEFARLIKALQKPTAKIQPLVRPAVVKQDVKTDVKEEARQESLPVPTTSSRPQRARKRKIPHGVLSSELKSLLSPSYIHPPVVILPSRRRSHKQEDKKVEGQEEETVSRIQKRKSSLTVEKVPHTGQPSKKKVKKIRSKGEREKTGPDVSIVGAVSAPGGGEYQVVCKTGSYQCPLCSTCWSLNQTYGRHVVSRTCQVDQDKGNLTTAPWILAEADHDEDLAILDENVSPRSNIFVSVNPATTKKDSFVSTSHVPSLKLLCRGVIPRSSKPPPIRVQEGLEYYHALVWPDNNKEEIVFKYVCRLANLTMVTSVKEYEKLCREPLKVALYLEKKIGKSRDHVGHRHSQTRRWVEKYTLYLTFPLHDIFLVVSQTGYRVLEFPMKEGKVGLLCLVCPTMSCRGCLANQSTKLPTWQPGKKPPLKVTVRTMPKVKKVKLSTKSLNQKISQPSAVPVPQTSKPVSPPVPPQPKESDPKLPPLTLQLHICSPCKTVFNSRLALSSHRGLCKGAGKE